MGGFDLERFLAAQDGVYAAVLRELAAGAKRSHWMWFIFPQLRGLGQSETARFYGITSRAEAGAYFMHPVLGERLRDCTARVNAVRGRSANAIFGSPDDLKFRSSMTLFDAVAPGHIFQQALAKYFDSTLDPRTVTLLAAPAK